MAYAVLTRDVADAQPYAVALAALGLEAVPTPVTRSAPAADPEALPRALAAGGHDAILVASPRAAHELGRARDATLATLPAVWAVGAATARALAIAKIRAHHPDGVRDGAELARRVVASGARRVLVPRAEDGRDEGLAILRAAGAVVDDVVAYRTVALPPGDPQLARGLALLVAGDAAVTAVFAPSQVTALGAALAIPLATARTRWAAIGETTAAALRGAGCAEVAVAAAPTPEGIANAVASVYRSAP